MPRSKGSMYVGVSRRGPESKLVGVFLVWLTNTIQRGGPTTVTSRPLAHLKGESGCKDMPLPFVWMDQAMLLPSKTGPVD